MWLYFTMQHDKISLQLLLKFNWTVHREDKNDV